MHMLAKCVLIEILFEYDPVASVVGTHEGLEPDATSLGANVTRELSDKGRDPLLCTRVSDELRIQRPRGWRFHPVAAPVMMATASVMECEVGVIVAAHFPSRCM